MKNLLLSFTLLALFSCGSGSSSKQISAEEETAIVDSVSKAVDQAKSNLIEETSSTTTEIDSLLTDI